MPLPDGRYEVTLGFVEPDGSIEAGERVFNVAAEGQPAIDGFDVVEAAGGALSAATAAFTVDVTGGSLLLEFTPTAGEALVSNITITAAGPVTAPDQ